MSQPGLESHLERVDARCARPRGAVVKSQELWRTIHTERANLIDTWIGLTSEQWSAPSLCARVVDSGCGRPSDRRRRADARSISLSSSPRPDSASTPLLIVVPRRIAATGPTELVRRLQARTTTTNHPPGPVSAMLGEVVVHGADIRRPWDLHYDYPSAALVEVANGWKNLNMIIGVKRRIAGVRLKANDVEWTTRRRP